MHIDINNVSQIHKKLSSFYGPSRPFGILANRVNSYSIDLLDLNSFKQIMDNLCAYGIISHNLASAMNADIESKFCSRENIHFGGGHDGELLAGKTEQLHLAELNVSL